MYLNVFFFFASFTYFGLFLGKRCSPKLGGGERGNKQTVSSDVFAWKGLEERKMETRRSNTQKPLPITVGRANESLLILHKPRI